MACTMLAQDNHEHCHHCSHVTTLGTPHAEGVIPVSGTLDDQLQANCPKPLRLIIGPCQDMSNEVQCPSHRQKVTAFPWRATPPFRCGRWRTWSHYQLLPSLGSSCWPPQVHQRTLQRTSLLGHTAHQTEFILNIFDAGMPKDMQQSMSAIRLCHQLASLTDTATRMQCSPSSSCCIA